MVKYNSLIGNQKKTVILILLIFCFNFSFSQYGWTDAEVHLKNGKVLNGEAKIPMMSSGVNLKVGFLLSDLSFSSSTRFLESL